MSSNMLENVVLLNARGIQTYTLFFRMLFCGCRNLKRLVLTNFRYVKLTSKVEDAGRALQDLLQNCGQLEELHSSIPFDPNYLRNCKRLRSLKLTFDGDELINFFCRITSDLLQCLPSLEVFALSHAFEEATIRNKSILSGTATILNSCPKLTSLGYLDSSVAIKEFRERGGTINLRTPRRFQLLRCFWATSGTIEQSEYNDMIRLAALSFPLLKVLVMRVHHADSLQHLKTLRYLNSLTITFLKTEQKLEFYPLLNEIGPQLQYLYVKSKEGQFNVDMMIDNCPNLRTLILWCSITADETVKPCVNLRQLEHLKVFECDRKSLLFLLSKCHHLKVLSVMFCQSLNDELLRAILKENCFGELEEALFVHAPLSKWVVAKFFKTARMLRKFSSGVLHDEEWLRYLKDLSPSVTLHLPADYLEIENRDHFFWHCPL